MTPVQSTVGARRRTVWCAEAALYLEPTFLGYKISSNKFPKGQSALWYCFITSYHHLYVSSILLETFYTEYNVHKIKENIYLTFMAAYKVFVLYQLI